ADRRPIGLHDRDRRRALFELPYDVVEGGVDGERVASCRELPEVTLELAAHVARIGIDAHRVQVAAVPLGPLHGEVDDSCCRVLVEFGEGDERRMQADVALLRELEVDAPRLPGSRLSGLAAVSTAAGGADGHDDHG